MKFKNHALGLLLASTIVGLPALAADLGSTEESTVSSQFLASVPEKSCPESGKKGRCGKGHEFRASLTDEQLEKLSALKGQYLAETASQKTELRSLKRQQRNLITKAGSDRNEIMALQDKINDLKAKLATSTLKFKLDGFAVLTPDQQKQVRHRMLIGQTMGGFHHRGQKHNV